MVKAFYLNGFLIFCAAVLQITAAGDDLDAIKKEYSDRATTVAYLARIYAQYEDLVKKGENASEVVLKRFFSKFEAEFDDSDQWLLNTFVQEEGLIKFALARTKYHYLKIKTFLETSGSIIHTAIFIHIRYLTIRGNLTAAEKVEDFQKSATEQLKNVADSTLRFVREVAWKKQFKLDIDEILRNQSTNPNVHIIIKNRLSEKYPFRAWLVLRKPSSMENYMCHSGLHYEGQVTAGKEKLKIHVIQREAEENYSHQDYAGKILNNIPNSKSYWLCKDRMKTIYEESEYKCSSKKLTFFSVFKLGKGAYLDKLIATKDRKFMFTKVVKRSAWFFFCKHRYEILLFG